AYARHINGDVLERAIFEYDYVVEVELPEGARTLAAGSVLSDTRDPCFYARRHGRRLYMGYEETAETSPEIMRDVARRTLEEGKRIFPALRSLGERDMSKIGERLSAEVMRQRIEHRKDEALPLLRLTGRAKDPYSHRLFRGAAVAVFQGDPNRGAAL